MAGKIESLDGLDGLVAGDVREPRGPDDVTRGVDSLDGGLVAVVGLDVAAIGESEHQGPSGQERLDADGHQRHVGLDGLLDTLGIGNRDADGVCGGAGLDGLVAEQEVDALLGKGFLQGDGNLRVLDGEEVRQHLDDGHLGAEGVEEVGELHTDRSGADDHDGLGLLGKNKRFLGADDGLAVEGQTGQGAGDAAGGHEDVLGRVRLLGTVGGFDDDLASLVDAGFPAEEIDLVLLEKEIESAGSLLGNVSGALDDFIPVVLEA